MRRFARLKSNCAISLDGSRRAVAEAVPLERNDKHDVVVYTRQGCHLCDEAGEVLARQGLTFRKVDIDADPELQARYTECVPVVVIDGRERFRGRVDPVLLRRLLAHDAAD